MNFAQDNNLREYLARDPIPITPFLVKKCNALDDQVLAKSLEAMRAGYVPNTIEWCKRYGTIPPLLLDVPIDGVRLSGAHKTQPPGPKGAA